MEPDAKTKARIVLLNQEMDAIHRANTSYWKQKEVQTLTAKSEYQSRNERLEGIRAELIQLRGGLAS